METTERSIAKILHEHSDEAGDIDHGEREGLTHEICQATTLDAQILRYVEWCKDQIDEIDRKTEPNQAQLRALVYQAQHYRYQAGILAETANFIGDEAERALQALEGTDAETKLSQAVEQIEVLTSLFTEAIDKIRKGNPPKTEPTQADPYWEGPNSDAPGSVYPSAQETGEAPSDADTLQA